MIVPCHRSLHDSLDRLDKHAIFAQLFLHQDDLFLTPDHEVAPGIDGAFSKCSHLTSRSTGKNTFRTPKHNGHSPYANVSFPDCVMASFVEDVDYDWGGVCHVSKPAFVRCKSWMALESIDVGNILMVILATARLEYSDRFISNRGLISRLVHTWRHLAVLT